MSAQYSQYSAISLHWKTLGYVTNGDILLFVLDGSCECPRYMTELVRPETAFFYWEKIIDWRIVLII